MATNHAIPTNKGYCPRGLGSSLQNCIGWFDSTIALNPFCNDGEGLWLESISIPVGYEVTLVFQT